MDLWMSAEKEPRAIPVTCMSREGRRWCGELKSWRSHGQVDRKSQGLPNKTQPSDSPVTLGKVSAWGSYYIAAGFFPSDWKGRHAV